MGKPNGLTPAELAELVKKEFEQNKSATRKDVKATAPHLREKKK